MTAAVGHNSGDMRAAALGDIRRRLAPFARRKRDFLRAAGRVQIRDRHDAGAAADLIGLARDVRALVDAERKAIVGPHDEALKAANGRTRAFWDDVDQAMRIVQARLDEFAAAEERRIETQRLEQEAEIRRRQEALKDKMDVTVRHHHEAAIAAGKHQDAAGRQPKRRSYRGDYGRQATVGGTDVIEISNWRELPDWVFGAEAVQEAIRKVVKPMVRQKIVIPGLTVTKATKTSVRK